MGMTVRRALLRAANRRGWRRPRPVVLSPSKLEFAVELIADGYGKGLVARIMGVDPATLRRHLRRFSGIGVTPV